MAALSGPRKWLYQAYTSLPGPVHALGEAAQRHRAQAQVRALPRMPEARHRLLIGPLDTAGQAGAWARTARTLPDEAAQSLSAHRRHSAGSLGHTADLTLTLAMQLRGLAVHRARVLGTDGEPGMTHVLAESGRPVLGDFHTGSVSSDLPALREAGIRTGLVIHGSELRDLRRHAQEHPHSPFAGAWDERWRALDGRVRRTRELLADFEGPVFVTTPDLLREAPGATLLPVVVDVAAFAGAAQGRGPALGRDRPVVLHAPSNPRLKGTAAVEEVLTRLHAEGLVTYRRLTGVPHARMPAAVADADVVVDQVVLGNPGVLLAEAAAAGCLVIAHLSQEVRDTMTALDPAGEPPPVLQADPVTLEEVLRAALADRPTHQELSARAPAWATRNHDGGRAAPVLGAFLGT